MILERKTEENVDNSQTHTQKEHIKTNAPPKTRTLSQPNKEYKNAAANIS